MIVFGLDFSAKPAADLAILADRELALRSRRVSLSMSIVTLMAVFITGLNKTFPHVVYPLLGAMAALSVGRLVLSLAFEKIYARSPRLWITGTYITSLVPAGLAGVGLVALLLQEGASWNFLVCLSSATALTAGASASMSPRLKLFYSYIVLNIFPPTIMLFFQEDTSAFLVAILLLFYIVQLLVFGNHFHKALWGKISSQYLLEKRASELEKANTEVLAANAAKDEFLANMSHELKTPLNGILGLTDLLLDTPLQDRQARYLKDVRTSGHRLLKTITSVLDYSRIDKGEWELHPTRFSLPELLKRVEASSAPLAQANGNKLILDLQPGLPEYLVGDAPAIGQIVVRLLDNAARFTRQGQITLRGQVHHRADSLATISIAVQDTGPGIAADKQDQIFRAFSQAKGSNLQNGSNTPQDGGTGLGLAMARRLAELMGGRITLASEPGQGATFTLLLTLPEAKPAARPDRSPQPAGGEQFPSSPPAQVPVDDAGLDACLQGLRVLLVEDNTVNAKLTTRILEKAMMDVTWAHNGKEAVNLFLQEEFDIVLMDIQMPVMDGFSATSALREAERERGGRVPIIALTAHAMPGYREKCLIGGMDDYLTKPLHPRTLRETLCQWTPANRTAKQS